MEPKTLIFVNPWSGIIGPNVGMQQLAAEALSRGLRVHVIGNAQDDFTDRLAGMGAVCHNMPELELTPRSVNPLVLVRHLWRAAKVVRRVSDIARRTGAISICLNGENMLMVPRGGGAAATWWSSQGELGSPRSGCWGRCTSGCNAGG